MQAVRWKNAVIGYGRKAILEDVNISIPRGSFALIYGDNGSGKTTLVKTLKENRLLKKGHVQIAEGLAVNMAYIPQQTAIRTFFPLTIFNTVAMGLNAETGYFRGLSHADRQRVLDMLTVLKLEHKAEQLLGECSGGEIKKTLLGRALIKHPALLIMDEPFVNVDDASKQIIIETVLKRNSSGMTVLLISHGHAELKQYAKLLFHVRQGGVHAA